MELQQPKAELSSRLWMVAAEASCQVCLRLGQVIRLLHTVTTYKYIQVVCKTIKLNARLILESTRPSLHSANLRDQALPSFGPATRSAAVDQPPPALAWEVLKLTLGPWGLGDNDMMGSTAGGWL